MIDRRNLLLLGASLLVGIALFEVGVRALGIDYNLSPNWRYQPILGWSQVPNASYDFVLQGRPVHVSFNAMGFRDRNHELAKPPGTKRIVVIGDSFCEAVQVNVEETFWKTLERLLNQRDSSEGNPTRWEVINIGVGDFGTAQEYIALKQYGLQFHPDVVIQEIFPLNDICNNSIGLYGLCRSHNDRYRPYFVESDGGLRQTSGDPIRTFLRHHFVTYDVLEYWMVKLLGPDAQSSKDPHRAARLRWRGLQGVDPLLDTFVPVDKEAPSVAAGWRVTEGLVDRIIRMTRQRGIAYVGMVVPFEVRLGPQWDRFVRMVPQLGMDRHYPEERFSALFRREGVGSVMLMDAFQPYLNEVLPYIDGHLSPAGHRRAAEALYRELVESGIAR